MSVNRLGKGLGALIRPEKEAKKKSASKRPKRVDEIAKIAISEIRPNPNQPRREFDQYSLQELANSIKEKGVVTPITVRKLDSRYELIAGERRWRASKILNKKTIPAYIIKVKNEAEIMEIALIENIQRKNLNAIEEAEAYEVLNTKYKMTHNQISNAVGKKRVTISNSLRLLKLPIDIRKSLRVGEITAGHARAILQAKSVSHMHKMWKIIIDKNLSVRGAEEILHKPKIKTKNKKKFTKTNPQILAIENQLIEILGTKVCLKTGKNGGSIEISYYSDNDLERILELINSI